MNEHEQVNDKSVSLSIRCAKLTGRVLAKAMAAALRQMKKARNAPKTGDQSMKRLTRTLGDASDKVEVGERIDSFERIARKHGVSYHIEREIGYDPPKHTIYFSAKQNGAMTAAFNEYAAMMVKREKDNKMPLRERFAKFKELIKSAPAKNRDRGGHEL
jgi:hypothetical protein